MSTVASLKCHRPSYTFEKDEYARIRMKPEMSPKYIIFVHDIGCIDDASDAESYHLLVTKYTFLASTYPFQAQQPLRDRDVALSDRELLLHFGDFNKMGKQDDAELIRPDDIVYAEDLTSSFGTSADAVDNIVRPPPGGNTPRQNLTLVCD
jgi:hypothetical protein